MKHDIFCAPVYFWSVLVLSLSIGLISCTTSRDGFEAELEQLVETQSSDPSRTAFGLLYHHQNEAEIIIVGGYRNRESVQRITVDTSFEIGSVSKLLVAVTVLQLVEERLVLLDQPIVDQMNMEGYLPPESNISVRDLLQHTSGIPDFFSSPEFLGSDQAYLDKRTPRDLLNLAFGIYNGSGIRDSDWDYSNTNYVVLGLLIEEITGQSAEMEIRDRIIDPLEMTGTWYRPSENPHLPYAVGYYEMDHSLFWDAWNGMNPANYSYAGAYASNLTDMDVFMAALVDGTLLSGDSLNRMMTFIDTPNTWSYGLGIIRREIGGRTWIGHGGSALGTKCWVLVDIDTGDRLMWYSTLGNDDFRSFERRLFRLLQ